MFSKLGPQWGARSAKNLREKKRKDYFNEKNLTKKYCISPKMFAFTRKSTDLVFLPPHIISSQAFYTSNIL